MEIDSQDFFVGVPGGRVYVKQWRPAGAGNTPIVLLHDSLGCVGLWRDFPAQLAAVTQRPVMAYDRLGFGRSSVRTQPPGLDFIDVEARHHWPALVEALALDRYVLMGHSVGGGMAVVIASLAGQQCVAVVSESAQAFVEQRTRDGIRAAQDDFADPAQFARLQRWHGQRAQWVLNAWTDVWLDPAFADWSLGYCLGDVSSPVLAIHGGRDEFGSPAFARFITDNSGGPATLALLPACGHVPHRDKPDVVLQRVNDFLADNRIA